jgi:hypothetical protein
LSIADGVDNLAGISVFIEPESHYVSSLISLIKST